MEGQPVAKRRRESPPHWPHDNRSFHERSLPPPRHGQPPPQPPRRHSDYPTSFGEDPHRRQMPYDYPQHQPREPSVKADPMLERPQLHGVRPHSTGHHPLDHGQERDDMRQPYDHANGANGTLHPPQPYQMQLPRSQIPAEAPSFYPPAMYDPSRDDPPRDSSVAFEFATSASSSQKKRSARTTMACEECRKAKAKCTDPKPCQGCKDKGVECKYDPPPPKQGEKLNSDIAAQINNLKDILASHALKEQKSRQDEIRRREMHEKRQKNQIRQQQEQLLLLRKVLSKMCPEYAQIQKEVVGEMGVDIKKFDSEGEMNMYGVASSVESHDEDEGEIIDGLLPLRNAGRNQRRLTAPLPNESNIAPVDSAYFDQIAPENHAREPKPYNDVDDSPNFPLTEVVNSIPRWHESGSHVVLNWIAVKSVWQRSLQADSIPKFIPLEVEQRRGVLRAHGVGEGFENPNNIGMHARQDLLHSTPRGSNISEGASPKPDTCWGKVPEKYPFQALSPTPSVRYQKYNPEELDPYGNPPMNQVTVLRLSAVYMERLNRMHPIITINGLDALTRLFLKQTAVESHSAQTVPVASHMGHPSAKRKRGSPSAEVKSVQQGRPQRSLSTAIVLLICALGRICEHKEKLPEVPRAYRDPVLDSPSTVPVSPVPTQHSPWIGRGSQATRSPSTLETSSANEIPLNQQVIPGLAYCAMATDIIGNHTGCANLQYVHACLLAGLYYGQLGRIVQSHFFIKEAGCVMQLIIEPRRDRFEEMKSDSMDPNIAKRGVKHWGLSKEEKRKDNHILFAFWTCLQLESDILAELSLPQSGVTTYESLMPYPHLDQALEDGELDDLALMAYQMLLEFRRELNMIHQELYGPRKHAPFSNAYWEFVQRKLMTLQIQVSCSRLAWREDQAPAGNILEARVRGKMYGAQNLLYRHSLRAVLDNVHGKDLQPQTIDHARKGVKAMKASCKAFWNATNSHDGGRLVVTNVWGTAHAQWSNAIVLHAVHENPTLQNCINRDELITITAKVRDFLMEVKQPGSAIAEDLRFLDAVSNAIGILGEVKAMSTYERKQTISANRSFDSDGLGEPMNYTPNQQFALPQPHGNGRR